MRCERTAGWVLAKPIYCVPKNLIINLFRKFFGLFHAIYFFWFSFTMQVPTRVRHLITCVCVHDHVECSRFSGGNWVDCCMHRICGTKSIKKKKKKNSTQPGEQSFVGRGIRYKRSLSSFQSPKSFGQWKEEAKTVIHRAYEIKIARKLWTHLET